MEIELHSNAGTYDTINAKIFTERKKSVFIQSYNKY